MVHRQNALGLTSVEDILALSLVPGLVKLQHKGRCWNWRKGRVSEGRAVIQAQQEGSGIESNLGHGIAPPPLLLPPHYKRSHLRPDDILFALTGCPHDSYIYTPKWHHCQSNPSKRKNGLIDRNSQFPSRLLQAKRNQRMWALFMCSTVIAPVYLLTWPGGRIISSWTCFNFQQSVTLKSHRFDYWLVA